MFGIPIGDLNGFSTCWITKECHKAQMLKEAKVIIWDKIGAQHRHAVEAVDCTLRNIRNCNKPFGGVTTVLGGDFPQTLPVVPRGSREEMVDAGVQRLLLWQHVHVLKLVENMRLQDAASPDTQAFAQWLWDVGHGTHLHNSDSGKVGAFPSQKHS